jgi:hypothetical protein
MASFIITDVEPLDSTTTVSANWLVNVNNQLNIIQQKYWK